MIKALLSAITGIPENVDDEDYQELWQNQKIIDELDLDDSDQFLLPPAIISDEDEFYSECAKEGINLIDRVNGKPVAVFHYSIDRPSANWHSPKEDDSDDETPKKWWQL